MEGCYVDCIGELHITDRITEVNGISLQDYSNEDSLNILKEAIKLGEFTLKRTRSHAFLKESLKTVDSSIPHKELGAFTPPKQILKRTVEEVEGAKESAVEAPGDEAEEIPTDVFIVDLTKGSNGLGFTVTSKDVITSKTTRIFIKNILGRGAAIQDGRIQPGDELLMVNDVAVSGKTQGDVVKLLRQADGTVILKLSRLKGSVPLPTIKSQLNVTPPTSPLSKKQLNSSPAVKAMLPSPPIKTPLGPSPLMKNPLELSPLSKTTQSSPIPIMKLNNEFVSTGGKECLGKDVLHEAPLYRGYINLTIPISIQSNVGLGISVKGKIMKETGDEKGIFVKSIVPGTNAERDGRVLVGDQLISINDVSLTNMSNSVAMSLLKKTLAEAGKEGMIRISVNRSVYSAESESESVPSQTSCGSIGSQSDYIQSMHTAEDKKDHLEKQFDQLYLTESTKCKQKENENALLYHGINRNKSYFKAVGGHSPKSIELLSTKSVKTNDSSLTHTSQPIFFQPESELKEKNNIIEGKLWGTKNKEKYLVLPTYEEALHTLHRESNMKTDKNKSDAVKFNLPATSKNEKRTFNKSISIDSSIKTPKSDKDIEAFKVTRGISTASQSSIDSILVDSNKIPFTRDGPGRLSMSEKKGRAQIDATKSRFYNKLKKFKSMEELRAPEGDNFKLNHDYGEMDMRRVSSIDTLTSRMDEEEKIAALFNRGTVYSSSTPYYTNEEQRNRVGQRLRARNNALNESFKSALERTISTGGHDHKDLSEEKKKKGFLNSIGVFLKRAKKRKDDELDNAHSPEYITNPLKFPFNQKSLLDVYEDVENNNKHDTINSHISDPSKYLQADQLQKQLVEAKINQMHSRDRKDKSKKYDTTPKSNTNKNESTPKKMNDKPYVPLTGYHTWQAHDPKNMREKSKQFFTRDSVSYQSGSSSNSLQRQTSLPSKNSTEVHRVLPRAPSGPMYKSPDRSKLRNDYNSPTSSSNKQSSESRNHRKHDKDSQQRTPGKLKSNDIKKPESKRHEHRVAGDVQGTVRLRRHESIERRDELQSNTNSDTAINRRSLPSISDLKLRSSVSISHKAQI